MSRHGPPRTWTKAQRRKREMKERLARVTKHLEKIDLLRALMLTHEGRGEKREAAKINSRIRTLEQQVRYIGVDPEEPLIE